ncbi:ABC transporter ATP-binding protein [Cellulomonas citrea]|uniref:ABC transporter ATP-binding protein n=1 Tax=Cellulomonas citrea TaxID=1909423 RepID=UPI00191663BB|nr:ABC transporter ATP-binding protein [Cellulomonas citrea]
MADTRTEAAPVAGPRPSVVEVRDLHVDFATDRGPVHAVRGIDLDLAVGQVHALVGESGSGKSVTGLTIMGLTRGPRTTVRGAIRYGGRDLVQADESWMRSLRGRELAMVFQDPMTSLNPMHPVGRQIAETLQVNAGRSRRVARADAVELLDRVGIREPAKAAARYPHEFSGGMRQRVVIAIALACEPAVLVADEPTTALDVTVQAQVLDLMVGLARASDTAVLLVTHDLGVVARYAEQVSVMRSGQILERGPAQAVLGDPQHDYTRALLAAIPRLHGPRRRRLSPVATPG